MICVKCGKDIPEGAAFCCWCGARCGERRCAVCGTKLRIDQIFCHECGTKCDDSVPQAAEQVPLKWSASVQENTVLTEDREGMQKNHSHRLIIRRDFQLGSSDMLFEVYVDGRNMGYIGSGEALYADIPSGETAVEIRFYANEMLTGKLVLKVIKSIVLVNPDHPKILFMVSNSASFREGNMQYPKIDAVVSGASILRQEQRMFR